MIPWLVVAAALFFPPVSYLGEHAARVLLGLGIAAATMSIAILVLIAWRVLGRRTRSYLPGLLCLTIFLNAILFGVAWMLSRLIAYADV
jgi:flagellar biosynthesis protein FliQ